MNATSSARHTSKNLLPLAASAALLLALGGTAVAQTSARKIIRRIDNRASEHRTEMMLRVSPTTLDVMAAWQQHPDFQSTNIHYNVSIDGGNTFRTSDSDPPVGPIPLPQGWTELQGNDPQVAFDKNGTGWVGYVGFNPAAQDPLYHYGRNDRFWIAQKTAGVDTVAAAVASTFTYPARVDKPALGAGPWYGSSGDVLGLI